MRPGSRAFIRRVKVILWPLCLAPLALLVAGALGLAGQGLGANPVETVLHTLGKWGLKFLLLTLAVTPLSRWMGWTWLIAYRRLLGLFAFFYVSLHLTTYLVLDQWLAWPAIVEDVLERPYITLGMAAVLLLVPLAATSTRAMMRRMGQRWRRLHRLIYPAAILGVWHFWWQVKQDILEPLVYAVILGVLLGARLWWFRQRRTARRAPVAGRPPDLR